MGAKISDATKAQILVLRDEGMSYAAIGDELDVNESTVSRICRGLSATKPAFAREKFCERCRCDRPYSDDGCIVCQAIGRRPSADSRFGGKDECRLAAGF